jgi:hypothetical protein
MTGRIPVAPRAAQAWRIAAHRVRWFVSLGLVLLALAVAPGVALAQDTSAPPQPKEVGWWIGGGGGYLAGRADCSNCEAERNYGDGGAFLFQGGFRVRNRLHVGAELYSTSRTMPAGTFRDTQMLGVFQYRPFASLGFFLKGGYGMAFVRDAIPIEGVEVTARTSGMGVMYGAGWEFPVGRNVSFAPLAATYITTVGDVTTSVGTAQNVVINGWFAGALLMIH